MPIVMTVSAYPDKIGLVQSLDRPGGNVTGLSNVSPDLMGKRFELLKEFAPKVSRVAVLWNPASPVEPNGFRAVQAAGAATRRLPDIYEDRPYIESGGLLTYGPSFNDMFRRTATYVDKILKGAKPAGLPVEQPIKFELLINPRTAKALGLTIPKSMLERGGELI
jgi:putative tryptophan/tyrosine transport system substrate-binding protein